MQRKQLTFAGALTVGAVAVAALGIALSGGQPPDHRDSTPAGQVENLPEPVAPGSTTSPAAPTTMVPQDTSAVADDAPVNQPAPAEDVPPAGVPYDSDGGIVVPNPPNMGPDETAPAPPPQYAPELPPVGQPEIPNDPGSGTP